MRLDFVLFWGPANVFFFFSLSLSLLDTDQHRVVPRMQWQNVLTPVLVTSARLLLLLLGEPSAALFSFSNCGIEAKQSIIRMRTAFLFFSSSSFVHTLIECGLCCYTMACCWWSPSLGLFFLAPSLQFCVWKERRIHCCVHGAHKKLDIFSQGRGVSHGHRIVSFFPVLMCTIGERKLHIYLCICTQHVIYNIYIYIPVMNIHRYIQYIHTQISCLAVWLFDVKWKADTVSVLVGQFSSFFSKEMMTKKEIMCIWNQKSRTSTSLCKANGAHLHDLFMLSHLFMHMYVSTHTHTSCMPRPVHPASPNVHDWMKLSAQDPFWCVDVLLQLHILIYCWPFLLQFYKLLFTCIPIFLSINVR